MYQVEEIRKGIWWLEGEKHSSFYVVTGSEKAAVIDTGMDEEAILPAIRQVTELPLELIITHAHWDHIHHVDEFPSYKIAKEEELLLKDRQDKSVREWIAQGEQIDLGGKVLQVIALTGHTPGSLLFVDTDSKVVFTGDAIGSGCGVWMQVPGGLSIRQYRQSLAEAEEKLLALGVNDQEWLFLGGHKLQAFASTVSEYNLIGMELIADMIVLCDRILAGEAQERISTAKQFTEEAVYFASYGRAEMEYVKSRIKDIGTMVISSDVIIDFLEWIKENKSSELNIGYVRECIYRGKYYSKAYNDLDEYCKMYIKQKRISMESNDLVEKIEYYLNHSSQKEKQKIEAVLWQDNNSQSDKIEIDLGKVKIKADKLVCLYCICEVDGKLARGIDVIETITRNGEVDKRLLRDAKSFLGYNNFKTIIQKIINRKENIDVEELMQRYLNPNIVKCIFLPLASDESFKDFVDKCWNELNELSADYIDIFYSVRDLSASGYTIKNEFRTLKLPEDALPCLVLWTTRIEEFYYVEIRDLDYHDIFHLMQTIVQNIKEKKTFETIYKEAVKMANKKREQHIPVKNYNIFQNVGNVTGNIAGVIEDSEVHVENNTGNDFVKQFDWAIERINTMSEIDENQKQYLESILNEAKNAETELEKQSCKNKFEAFMKGVGKVAETILSTLSDLVTVVAFFGIGR